MGKRNTKLNNAKQNKFDEFYTPLSDIEAVLSQHTEHFRGKSVYCNCDDYEKSNFVRYFRDNFDRLGLQKLTATNYNPKSIQQTLTGVVSDPSKSAYRYVMQDGKEEVTVLEGDGDFRSSECIDLLKESDIIVTNPPFSLLRAYIEQLLDYNKHFMIICEQNAVTYPRIFENIVNGSFRILRDAKSTIKFEVPDCYLKQRAGVYYIDKYFRVFVSVNIKWLTNLDINQQYEMIELHKRYSPAEYPKYDNYDAIEVSKYIDIPIDYTGLMGLPITFLDKYNPEQFEIAANDVDAVQDRLVLHGKRMYARILVRNRHPAGGDV